MPGSETKLAPEQKDLPHETHDHDHGLTEEIGEGVKTAEHVSHFAKSKLGHLAHKVLKPVAQAIEGWETVQEFKQSLGEGHNPGPAAAGALAGLATKAAMGAAAFAECKVAADSSATGIGLGVGLLATTAAVKTIKASGPAAHAVNKAVADFGEKFEMHYSQAGIDEPAVLVPNGTESLVIPKPPKENPPPFEQLQMHYPQTEIDAPGVWLPKSAATIVVPSKTHTDSTVKTEKASTAAVIKQQPQANSVPSPEISAVASNVFGPSVNQTSAQNQNSGSAPKASVYQNLAQTLEQKTNISVHPKPAQPSVNGVQALAAKVFGPNLPNAGQKQIQAALVQERLRDSSLNAFAPMPQYRRLPMPDFTPRPFTLLSSYGSFYPNNYLSPSQPPINLRWIVQDAIQRELNSGYPSLLSAYFRASSQLGLGYNLSLGEFRSVVSSSSLISSYNRTHTEGSIRALENFAREIGGVGTEVACITDLINSEAHLNATSYKIAFPLDGTVLQKNLLLQIAHELRDGYFKHKALPFFSLEFNNDGIQYPVLHPAYQNTLVGEVIGFLDYWMKGFLNGGIYDKEFLKNWSKLGNYDENYLRTQLINLKDYCKTHTPGLHYASLRERQSKQAVGAEEKLEHTAYNQPFITGFRIIAYQKRILRHNDLLIPEADFRVEYSIDLMPDYAQYVEDYRKQHGKNPPEYDRLRQSYESFAEEVREKMPQLPFCRDFFDLLGAMNGLCYLYVTLEKMGKRPILPKMDRPIHPFPKALPPLPVQHFKTYPLKLQLHDLLSGFMATDNAIIDKDFYAQFSHPRIRELPALFAQKIPELAAKKIKEKLPELSLSGTLAINEEELAKIAKITSRQVIRIASGLQHALKERVTKLFDSSLPPIPYFDSMLAKLKPLPEQVTALRAIKTATFEETKARWQQSPHLAKTEIFSQVDSELHETVNKIFKTLEAQQELQSAKQMLEAQLNQYSSLISTIQQNKASELAKIPPHLHALNQANINAFVTERDQKIAQVQAEINKIYPMLAEVNADLTTIQKLPKLVKASQLTTAVYQEQALNFLETVFELEIEDLDKITAQMEHFTTTLQEIALESKLEVTDKYTHAMLGFTGPVLNKKTNERFRIHGGCGFVLPNLVSEPLEIKDLLNIQADPLNPSRFHQLTYQQKKYTTLTLPVEDVALQLEEKTAAPAPAASAQLLIEEVVEGKKPVAAIPSQMLSTAIDSSGASPLHYAAAVMDEARFSQLLAQAPKIQPVDALGQSAIHVAAMTGNTEAVTAILKQDTKQLHAQNRRGMTALLLAIQYGKIDTVKALLGKGADINHRLPNGLFPLFLAIQSNFPEIALLILQQPNHTAIHFSMDSGQTALHLAIDCKMIDVAATLLEKGALGTAKRKTDGFTPLHAAAEADADSLIEALVKRGVAVDLPLESKKTPLHLAAAKGNLAAVSRLLALNANVNTAMYDGDTPLMLAIKGGHHAVALRLAEKAALNTRNDAKQTASLLAIQAGMPKIADILIARGEQPSLVDNENHDYTYYLICHGEYHRILTLLDQKRFDVKKSYGTQDLLELAAMHGHSLLVYEFLNRGLRFTKLSIFIHYVTASDDIGLLRNWLLDNVPPTEVLAPNVLEMINKLKLSPKQAIITNGPDKNHNFVYQAFKAGAELCANLFLQTLSKEEIISEHLLLASLSSRNTLLMDKVLQRIDTINMPLDADGQTILHHAVRMGSCAILEFLLERGADVRCRDGKGSTAFHLAIEHKDSVILKRLLKLTKTQDWPIELWAIHPTASASILQVLKKYQKHLPQTATSIADAKPSANLPISKDKFQGIPIGSWQYNLMETANWQENLMDCIEIEDFVSAEKMLREVYQFNNQQKPWLQRFFTTVFSTISLPLPKPAEVKEKTVPDSGIEKLLAFFQQAGLDPSPFRGKSNALVAMLTAETEALACYRLQLFIKYFPQSVPILVQDELSPHVTVMTLALKRGFTQFFKDLDTAILGQKPLKSRSGLLEAVLCDNYAAVLDALTRYPVDVRDGTGQTPLMVAALKGNKRLVEHLLSAGASPNALDRAGLSALHFAINGASEATALLLFPLTRNHRTERFGTTLHMAARQGLVNIVRLACNLGVDKEAVDRYGRTALHVAAAEGKTAVITALIEASCIKDPIEAPQEPKKIQQSRDCTPLHLAAKFGHVDAVQSLLMLGANPEQCDRYGWSLYEYAIQANKMEMLQFIAQFPAYHGKNHEERLLHAACSANNLQVASELILGQQVNLNAQSKTGLSALHYCALYDASDVTEALVAGGKMAVDLPDPLENTALHYAAQRGNIRIMQALIRAGAQLDIRNDEGKTPLFLASEAGQLSAVMLLLKEHADFTITDNKARIPEQVAQKLGYSSVVACFQKAGKATIQKIKRATIPLNSEPPPKAELSTPVQAELPLQLARVSEEKSPAANLQLIDVQKQTGALKLEVDYHTFRKKILEILAQYSPEAKKHWTLWCNHLDRCKGSNAEKLLLLKIASYRRTSTSTATEFIAFINAAFTLKKQVGSGLFYTLFCRYSEKLVPLETYQRICELLTEFRSHKDALKLVQEHLPNWDALYEGLKTFKASYALAHAPKRDLSSALIPFSQASEAVQFPLSKEQLSLVQNLYLSVRAELKEISALTSDALLNKAKKAGKNLPENTPTLVALFTEVIYRCYGIYPHDTQVLALLGIINYPSTYKGCIAQIKTGEGKSMMIAMLSAFYALNGRNIDIVTSSDELAVRDSVKYASFYKALDLEVSHICVQDPEPKHFEAHIVYGAGSHFEFVYLRDGLRKDPHRKTHGALRAYDVVIVDEADNLFLRLNSAIISTSHTENDSWIYAPILEFAKKTAQTSILPGDIKALREHLQRLNPARLSLLDDGQLSRWLSSAKEALFVKKKNRDYVVKANEASAGSESRLDIRIVDYENTGRECPGSQWPHGMHQFLQVKENLEVTPETLAIASISPSSFFNLYQTRLGLTGTMGTASEREEIQATYNMSSFDVPPHFPVQRAWSQSILEYDSKAYNTTLLTHIRNIRKTGRPILVLFESIESSEAFSLYSHEQAFAHQVLNENQAEKEDYVIAKAGLPGMVTYATNTAGRGTDIILAAESLSKGGLHVIFTFYPHNLRVQVQGLGRSNRQGQPGSGNFVLNMQTDSMIKVLLRLFMGIVSLADLQKLKAEDALAFLDKLRLQYITIQSHQRQARAAKEALCLEKLQTFFAQLQSLHQALESTACRESMLTLCHSSYGQLFEGRTCLKPVGSHWLVVQKLAVSLLEQQSHSPVDWSYFIQQFTDAYTQHVKTYWATFYSQIQDKIADIDNLENAKTMIEHEYSAIQANLSYYCSGPQAALGYFCGILMVAHITLSGMTLENAIEWGPPRPYPGKLDWEKDSNSDTEEQIPDLSKNVSYSNFLTELIASINQNSISIETIEKSVNIETGEQLDNAHRDNNQSIYPNRSALFKTSIKETSSKGELMLNPNLG